ncbi:cytochrome P450 [Mycena rosella]|uniref:Cytochrome P450 n=1 Tax=Mycena rosella TaxID=1033263 RepID=A0AAD7GTD6_MYCRO|nr:cytochrome P450 [Mycena rosella]
MYPDVTVRLREEIMACVGPANAPTYKNIKPTKYLGAVINGPLIYELTICNASSHRETIKATTWPSPNSAEKPIYIPAGVKVPYSMMIMQRRKDLWGPDANEFDPDRFLDERVHKYLVANLLQFLLSNAGPRICLGQQSFVIIRLLQNFSLVSLAPDAGPPHAFVPAEWEGKAGRKGVEQFRPRSHLTMYTLVSKICSGDMRLRIQHDIIQGGLWVKMKEV